MLKGKTRKQLLRLYDLADKVPFPASGSHSTTVAGLAAYSEDMRVFTPAFKAALFSMLIEGTPAQDEFDHLPADTILDNIESWIKERQQATWVLPGHLRPIKICR